MNLEPYKHLRDGNDLEPMDGRHVQMIHAVLCGEQLGNVVNIGVANGFSCAATLEAAKAGYIENAYFVDVNIRESFSKAIAYNMPLNCKWSSVQANSAEFYEKCAGWLYPATCWVIDGDHKEGAVTDYENARKFNARIIIAHDTNPEWSPAVQWGAIEIGKRMREGCVAYFEDWADRKGEYTKRGLTIAFYYQPKQETMDRLQAIARSE